MAQIAIVGGNGKIARHLIGALKDQGHIPLALVRNHDHTSELEALGATVGILDIENSTDEDFGKAFDGSDAIVFAAGGGPDGNIERKRTVDFEGSIKSIAGAKLADVHRFVQISAISVDKPVPEGSGAVWAAYVGAKRDADVALRASALDWTIIRPGGLLDEEPTGLITVGDDLPGGQIPRADVAAVLAAVVSDDRTIGKQWDVVTGPTEITEAIDAAV
ncbi:MAG: NAD(P)H-binding protein [Actinomycetota bacterium]|nr:NAD(P)H-binding protein [Actinomycetota bacterium]